MADTMVTERTSSKQDTQFGRDDAADIVDRLKDSHDRLEAWAEHSRAAADIADAADEIYRLRCALEAAKEWMEDITDPCGEPYNTICAALNKKKG